MSGSLRIVPVGTLAAKHDHVDINCADGSCLRFNDPRRFGCLLYTLDDPEQHKLLCKLGPEPLSLGFNAKYLFSKTLNKKVASKLLVMNAHIVVGVGNIYANEALFAAGINPRKPAGELTLPECQALCKNIKAILRKAIKAGGTTLQDFTQSDGKPGYFAQQLHVYGKQGQACPRCSAPLEDLSLGGRQTVFCPQCQH
jgi:formamidopyrimidine-DNA glycosylase